MERQPSRLSIRFPLIEAIRSRLNGVGHGIAQWISGQPQARAVLNIWNRLLDEACDMLAPVLGRLAQTGRLVVVARPESGFDVYRVERGSVIAVDPDTIGTQGSHAQVELRLRSEQLLERSLTLPAASRDYLATIIDHRLDRLTPWRRDRVLHGFMVTAEDASSGSLTVRVVLASADLVDGLISALRTLHLEPAAVGAGAATPGSPMPIVLDAGRGTAPRPRWQIKFGRVWLAGTVALGLLAVSSIVWASTAVDRQTEAERHLVKARRLIREAGDSNGTALDPALGDKRPEAATVVLIDKLAATLPDTTYLKELSVTVNDIRLAGTSADAPALIPLLEKAGFYDVRFTAPVARGEDRKDSFEITADRHAAAAVAQ